MISSEEPSKIFCRPVGHNLSGGHLNSGHPHFIQDNETTIVFDRRVLSPAQDTASPEACKTSRELVLCALKTRKRASEGKGTGHSTIWKVHTVQINDRTTLCTTGM